MEHSPKFEKVRNYYETGRWNLKMVWNAVGAHWITAAEFEEITGEPYETQEE